MDNGFKAWVIAFLLIIAIELVIIDYRLMEISKTNVISNNSNVVVTTYGVDY